MGHGACLHFINRSVPAEGCSLKISGKLAACLLRAGIGRCLGLVNVMIMLIG